MRPAHYLLTAALLTAGVLLIIRQAAPKSLHSSPVNDSLAHNAAGDTPHDGSLSINETAGDDARPTRAHPSRVANQRGTEQTPPHHLPNQLSPAPAATDTAQAGKVGPRSVAAEGPPDPVPSSEILPDGKARILQFADNVPMPAAIMALNTAEAEGKDLPAPIAAALHEIANSYDRELAAFAATHSAAAAAAAGENPTVPTADSPTQPESLLITPGPEVDAIRARANERYRALFGDEAYNRETMNGQMETRRLVEGIGGQ